jgi:adenine/guanine/hypoxanthine permease
MLERWFGITANRSTVRTELVAGVTTFMTMAYIIFVNPAILKNAGIPFSGAVTATCVASGAVTLLMGLFANYPFALASGMGLNALLAFGVVLGHKMSWQGAMGIVLIEGAIVLVLVLAGLRESVMKAIPEDLRRAIAAGIGLFIAFIGLHNVGIIVKSDATLVSYGSLKTAQTAVTVFGIVATLALLHWRVRGAILIGIVLSTIAGIVFGIAKAPTAMFSMPSFETIGKVDLRAALSLGAASVGLIFSFLMVDFFDTLGTVTALGLQTGHINKETPVLPRLRRVLVVDSLGAMFGGFCGASSVTTYIESASGISEGGRTGLASVVTAVLFFIAAFLSPLIGVVPAAATAPALIITGFLMMSVLKEIDFSQYDTAFAAFVIMLVIPLTYSISHGIGYGFIVYSAVSIFTGKFLKTHFLFHIVSAMFLLSFLLE